MRHSQIDKRAKRNCPKQCVSDYGMHKDAKKKWPHTEYGWRSNIGYYRRVDGGPIEPTDDKWQNS